ncbi:MAG: glycoside hydrolase family 3 protein [bacterium]
MKEKRFVIISAILLMFFGYTFKTSYGLDTPEMVLSRMTVEQKIGQLFMPGIQGQVMSDELKKLIQSNYLGGVILFGGRNVISHAQSAQFTQDLQVAAMGAPNGIPLLISIDQEGGVGSHINMLNGGVDTVGNLALGASPEVEDTYLSYSIMADDLRAFGVNMALAPVLDLLLNKNNPMNHIRSFGADPEAVSARARRAVMGFQNNGIVACIKHFPGKGNNAVDSHKFTPVTTEDRSILERTILAPFRAAIDAGADSVMLNHEIYTALDPDQVATLSGKIITDLLKGEMGFDGLVITDSITMGGVSVSADEASYLSIKAGADMILFAGDSPEAYIKAIAKVKGKIASGELSMERVDDAVLRILRVKHKYGLFENPQSAPADKYKIQKKKNYETSREIARRTITMVKNNGVLPLDRARAGRILVVSPGSFFSVPMMETVFPAGTSLAAKMKEFASGVRASIYDPKTLKHDAIKALETAKDVDVIVFGSILAYWSPETVDLVKKLKGTGKPVVVVGLSVPYDLERFPDVDAFLGAYCPRSVSLEAAVDAIFGLYNPAGKLPVDVQF